MALRRRGGGEFNPAEMGEGGGLNVVNLIDMFVIIIIFLLKSYSASTEANITISPKLSLPLSSTDKDLKEYVNVIVTRDEIMVEKKVVARIINGQIEGLAPNQLLIPSLYEELKKRYDRIQEIQMYNPNVEFRGEVNLIAHKQIPFSIIKKVMYTAGQVGFSEFKFVSQKES
jgi:biopolymer transport protein ExbD